MFKKNLRSNLFLIFGLFYSANVFASSDVSKLCEDLIQTILQFKFEKSPVFDKRTKSLPESVRGKLVTLKRIKFEYIDDYAKTFTSKVMASLALDQVGIKNLIYTELHKDQTGEYIVYTIFENEGNSIIGGIEIRKGGWCGNLGNWISEKYWGENCNKKGYYQESLGLITNLYFTAFPEATSLSAHVRKFNKRSYFALRKFGFQDFKELDVNISDKDDYTVRFTRDIFEQKHDAHA